MKETDIRPTAFNEMLAKACDDDVRFLLTEKNEWIDVHCPACDAHDPAKFGEKRGVAYERCKNCSTVYVNPRPSEDLLQRLYSHSKVYELWNTHIFPSSDAQRRENIYRPRADRLIDYCRQYGIAQGASFLEVGAGFGSFCDVVRAKNYFGTITAVEPTPQLAQACQKLGLNVIADFAERAIDNRHCDVFCSFEVIEHIFDPFRFVRNAFDAVSDNGLAVLSCPNPHGFDALMLGLKSSAFDHEHLNYFNPKSMAILLERAGFEILEITTPGKLDVDIVRTAVLNGDIDVTDQPFMQQLLVEASDDVRKEFQAFLASNTMSSHMLTVARKCSHFNPGKESNR